MKNTHLLILLLSLFSCSSPMEDQKNTIDNPEKIENEALKIANDWINAWNGKIDSENMMKLYHTDMKYVWRGVSPPGDYDGFKKFIEETMVPQSNFEISLSNPDVTIIDDTSAIIFFHFNDKNKSPYGSGAATLILTKTNNEWKVKYVHESSVEGE